MRQRFGEVLCARPFVRAGVGLVGLPEGSDTPQYPTPEVVVAGVEALGALPRGRGGHEVELAQGGGRLSREPSRVAGGPRR